MNSKIVSTSSVIVALTILWLWRHHELGRLQASVKSRSTALANPSPKRIGHGATNSTSDPEELRKLRELKPELMKLRASISGLRKMKDQSPDEIEKSANKKRQEANLITGWMKAEDLSNQISQEIGLVLSVAKQSSVVSGQPVPSNLDQIKPLLQSADGKQSGHAKMLLQMMEQGQPTAQAFARFEVIPFNQEIRLKDEYTQLDLLYLREKQARQLPDGKWIRFYARLNGNMEPAISDSGDFAEWERSSAKANP